ncbi:MAG: RluA family pseudouridine synthase [Candidatus Paceibacterota bacterium]
MTEIEILFQNDEILVIDKPAGLMVHEDGNAKVSTVTDWFLKQVPEARGVGEPQTGLRGERFERSGIVHRLDTDTSGVLVLAKTQEAFTYLKQQFHDRLVKKEYRAFVYGTIKEQWGTIERPIGRSARDFRLRSAERGAKGMLRDAVTNWERLKAGTYKEEAFSELRLVPKTGRTHQLRTHLKAIAHPIVGDKLYAGMKLEQSNNLELSRLALHAHTLELELKTEGPKKFIAPLPASFIEASARIAPRM